VDDLTRLAFRDGDLKIVPGRVFDRDGRGPFIRTPTRPPPPPWDLDQKAPYVSFNLRGEGDRARTDFDQGLRPVEGIRAAGSAEKEGINCNMTCCSPLAQGWPAPEARREVDSNVCRTGISGWSRPKTGRTMRPPKDQGVLFSREIYT